MSETHSPRTPGLLLSTRANADVDRAIRERGWELEREADPLRAFAQLALLTRAATDRAAWGLAPQAPPVLVLDGAPPVAFARALQTWLPEIEVWVARPEGLEQVALGAADQASASVPPRRPRRPDDESSDEDHRVTAEEIAMLFEEDLP